MDGDETDASNSAAPGPAKILLVDAEPRVTDRLRRQIEREGLEGLEASDLQTLREQLAYQPEVVFLDLEPEQSSGLELIGEMNRISQPRGKRRIICCFRDLGDSHWISEM